MKLEIDRGNCCKCPSFEQVNDLLFYHFGECKMDEDLTIIDMEVDKEDCPLEEE